MQEHHDDCHSYKRLVLGVHYRPEAADLRQAITSLRARQATHIKPPRATGPSQRTIENPTLPGEMRPRTDSKAALSEASSKQGVTSSKAPALRMGSRPLSVGGERGGRGGRGDGATWRPPQGRPKHARLASVARIPSPNPTIVSNSRDAHYRSSPDGDAHNHNGGEAAPLGVPPTKTHTTHQNKKALMAGASLP
jgi:hypothetical protein